MNNQTKDNITAVLKFWHAVEFFVPFDLDDITSRPNAKYQISEENLMQYGNRCLPWLSDGALTYADGDPSYEYRYALYLLPFDKSELTRISQQVFPMNNEEERKIEFEEKLDDEGTTCFARLTLDRKGFPDLEKISLSTLPWALGKLSRRNLDALNQQCCADEKLTLVGALDLLSIALNKTSERFTDIQQDGLLSAQSLLELLKLLKQWAGLSWDYPIAVVVEIIQGKMKNDLEADVKKETSLSAPFSYVPEMAPNNDVMSAHEPQIPPDELASVATDMTDILNSFYIEDLERVTNSWLNEKNPLLQDYIMGISDEKKRDIYDEKHHSDLVKKLHPDYVNHGRWPLANKHNMSLMQQFAIHECFHPSDASHLFSVNGPPGTGKTTLLQDIIAENVIQRARVLAEFKSSLSAFSGKKTITINNKETQTLDLLDPRLTGFEMIVVSSNNAAVENISKELPLKRKIAAEHQTACRYLESVATKLFADHIDKKVHVLKEEEKPWGLIAVALGNATNRNRFVERAFFAPEGKNNASERIAQGEYLTIWEWRKQYNGPSFIEAKKAFIDVEKQLFHHVEQVKKLTELYEKINRAEKNVVILNYQEKLTAIKKQQKKISQQHAHNTDALEKIRQEKAEVLINLNEHERFKPSLFQKLASKTAVKIWKDTLEKLQEDWQLVLEQERKLKQTQKMADDACEALAHEKATLEQHIMDEKNQQAALQKNWHDVHSQMPDIILPPVDNALDTEAVQLSAFWISESLNALRTSLFIAALKLHEAWLADVLKKNAFMGNLCAISALLSNKRPTDPANELLIWQSLFMWIPVISSTFASIGRQFKHIGANALGWFLMDEAGQALPQAAVGSIWRAKRVLMVGDPLQIEPVLTIPPNLIEGLACHILLTENKEKWLPTLVSVQTLADAANATGAYIDVSTHRQWIGCPLRVHRRCLDPMFSVSNKIAYDHKMVNARMNDQPDTQKSLWYHVTGNTTDRQYVPEQIQLLVKLFAAHYKQSGKLPPLYIITPFKRIKKYIQMAINDVKQWSSLLSIDTPLPNVRQLRHWCFRHIGTVHTFQGKEIETVIFVLGVDVKKQGAANWASSKPNLLNVALTRAKDTIVVIGDYNLWSRKPYFSELTKVLPRVDYTKSLRSIIR